MGGVREPINTIYRPQEDGTFLLFGGDLQIVRDGAQHTLTGQVELRLHPSPKLVAHFAGPAEQMRAAGFLVGAAEPTILVPPGASLIPPEVPVLPQRVDGNWIDDPVHVNYLQAGSFAEADHLIFHISGFEAPGLPVSVQGGGTQRHLDFELPGWDFTLTPAVCGRDDGFTGVGKATPTRRSTLIPLFDGEEVDLLRRRLFILLSFLANREVGVGPVCGCTERGEVVWAEWGAPRLRPGRPSFRWCPPVNLAEVTPSIARGFMRLSKDRAMEEIIDRAINHLFVASGEELIDARIPVLAAGLELLAWGQLRRNGYSKRQLKRLSAAESTRRLLIWAGVPVQVPARLDVFGLDSEASERRDGPSAVFGVRNALVHPPGAIDDPEWPGSAQLRAAHQLGTWYLELAILRILGYEGEYQTRLEPERYLGHVEPVPWADRGPRSASSLRPLP